MKLMLVRRGAVDVPDNVVLGQTDTPLAVAGFTAMQRLAASWEGRAPRFVFSSDLKRARQGAQVFAARFAVEPLVDTRLRELDYGRWEGRPWAEVLAEDSNAWRPWSHHWAIQAAPDGESFADLLRRSGAWLAALLDSTHADDLVLTVAHQGVIRALLCHALGLAPERSASLRIQPAHVTCIKCRQEHFEVCYSNVSRFQPE
ncbi:MAG TPA: histidine phosphatase family protein [Rhodanobacteraceae bacterium]|nr:histidine phosphatase family protein [Rhodanobacteraceae bacterium]